VNKDQIPLWEVIKQLPPAQQQTIKDAFYKAAEGLHALKHVLTTVTTQVDYNPALEAERALATASQAVLDQSVIGKLL